MLLSEDKSAWHVLHCRTNTRYAAKCQIL